MQKSIYTNIPEYEFPEHSLHHYGAVASPLLFLLFLGLSNKLKSLYSSEFFSVNRVVSTPYLQQNKIDSLCEPDTLWYYLLLLLLFPLKLISIWIYTGIITS